MARSVVLSLIGINKTRRTFDETADSADRTADRLDRLGDSADGTGRRADGLATRLAGLGKASDGTGKRFAALTGRTATLAAGLLTVAPAAQAAAAAAVAGAGAMAAAYGAAGAAIGAFAAAAGPQLGKATEAAELHQKAQEAAAEGGAKAAAANKKYQEALAKLPPATRETATALIALKSEHKKWSESLAGDTMPVFTKGINTVRAIMPKLTPLVKTAARELNAFMDGILKSAKGGGVDAWVKKINKVAGPVLGSFLRSVKNVAKGILGIFDAFLPHAPGMARGIEGLTAKFAKWGQGLKNSEGFRKFIDYVRAALPNLQVIFGNLAQIVGNLALAFAPMSGISLELIKNFTGILAALPPPLVTALATGFVAVAGAMRILNPLIATMNLLMKLNPIGIVVLALAGLAIGLYAAYKKSETFRNIVNTAWTVIKDAAAKAWEKIKPVLIGLGELFKKAKKLWDEHWPAMEALLTGVAAFFKDKLVGAINDVAQAFGGIAGKAAEATEKITGVGKGFDQSKKQGNSFLSWSTLFGAVLGQIFFGFTGAILGAITARFWPEMKKSFSGGFTWLKTKWNEYWSWLSRIVGIGQGKVLAAIRMFMTKAKEVLFGGLPPLRLSWSGFWTWLLSFTNRLTGVVKTGISKFLSGARSAFSTAVEAIGVAWRRLQDYAKKPVNFIIGTVHNKGIVGLWNQVMSWLKIDGMRLGKVPLLASGGPVPAATAGWANQPTAIYGEGSRTHPEVVIPTDPKHRSRAQALWAAAGSKIDMFARGGVLGGVLGGIKKAAGKIFGIGQAGMDLLANPGKIWDRLAGPVLGMASGAGTGPWASAIAAIPRKMLDQMKTAALQVVKAFNAGFGGDASGVVKAAAKYIGVGDRGRDNDNMFNDMWGWPAGTPWCANFVSTAIKDAKAGKKYPGYPTASVAVFNSRMRHVPVSAGRPGDLAAYRGTGHVNIIEKALGGGTYQTIGGNEGPVVQRGRRGGATSMLRPLARGGLLGATALEKGVFGERNLDPADRRNRLLKAWKMDGGGAVPPRSLALIHNATSRSEMVMSGAQQDLLSKGGNTYNINVSVPPNANQAEIGRNIVTAIQEYERRRGKGWRS